MATSSLYLDWPPYFLVYQFIHSFLLLLFLLLLHFPLFTIILIITAMSHRYDIDSDHLKCNFCTQWFKCTLHYANIQRYSLKACPRCLQHFHHTLLHPDTYRIYKVILFDTNIAIPKLSTPTTDTEQPGSELEQAEQDIKDRITRHFEQNVKDLLQNMDNSTKRVEKCITSLKEELRALRSLHPQQSEKGFLTRIEEVKSRPLQHWLNPEVNQSQNTLMIPNQKQLSKTSSSSQLLSSRRKYSQVMDGNKENMNQANQDWGKNIKFKAGIRNKENPLNNSIQNSKGSKNVSMKSSRCLYPTNQAPREKSPSLRHSVQKSAKRLGSCLEGYEERDLAEITRLLQAGRDVISYLPCQLQPQVSLTKNQSRRTQADSIIDLRNRITKGGELLELVGTDITKLNFQCLLKSLGQLPSTKIVRIIKVGLTDYEFDSLLKFLSKHPSIETVIVTNNRLTELSLLSLQNYLKMHTESRLQNVYLGSNRVSRQLMGGLVRQLTHMGVNVLL